MKLKNPTGKKQIILKKLEKKRIFLEDFSEKDVNFELEVVLEGIKAEVEIVGRAQSTENFSKKWVVRIIFQGLGQKASLDLKGTAEDNSFLEFDGVGILEKKSEDCEVNILERIVLFDKGKGKCLPVLTVKTDKVKKASHAASVSPFDQDQIVFCQARGISKKLAEGLLKKGFLGEIINY